MTQSWKLWVPTFFFPNFGVNTDPENSTVGEEVLLQNNDIALSAIHDVIDERTFEQIKNIEMAHDAWKKLEESFEELRYVYIFQNQLKNPSLCTDWCKEIWIHVVPLFNYPR